MGQISRHSRHACAGCLLVPRHGTGRHVSFSISRFAEWTLIIYVTQSAASETESPRRNIAKAVRRVFYRILVFYVRPPSCYSQRKFVDQILQILGILMIGMLVAYNDESLLSLQGNNTAASSPFVIAITRSGIKGMLAVTY